MKKAVSSKLLYVLFFVLALAACELEDFNLDSDDDRDKIVDTWSCSENSTEYGNNIYDSDISKDNRDSLLIYIDNFYQLGFGSEVYATLNNRTIVIPEQTLEGHIIEGTGTVSGNYETIRFEYTADGGDGIIDNVTSQYSRK